MLLYLDDIIVISPNSDTYLLQLEEVFQQLKRNGLKLELFKCEQLQSHMCYLGMFLVLNSY